MCAFDRKRARFSHVDGSLLHTNLNNKDVYDFRAHNCSSLMDFFASPAYACEEISPTAGSSFGFGWRQLSRADERRWAEWSREKEAAAPKEAPAAVFKDPFDEIKSI